MQKTFQQLREKNLKAATKIALYLKKNKTMSEETFGDLYIESTGAYRHGSFPKLIETTKQFLYDHDIMSTQMINGLIIHVATQKCWRSMVENFFIEYQTITNDQIDLAITYLNFNNGKVSFELEGKIIAENILELTGELAKGFPKNYAEFMQSVIMLDHIENKFGLLSTIRHYQNLKKIKKIN
jgi:hypothetical protein